MKQKKLQWLFSTNKFLLPAANFLQELATILAFLPPSARTRCPGKNFFLPGQELVAARTCDVAQTEKLPNTFCKECTYAELFTSTFTWWK